MYARKILFEKTREVSLTQFSLNTKILSWILDLPALKVSIYVPKYAAAVCRNRLLLHLNALEIMRL